MTPEQIAAAREKLGPYMGVSVLVRRKGEGEETVDAKLSGTSEDHVTVGGEMIPWDQIDDISLYVIKGGELCVPEDRA